MIKNLFCNVTYTGQISLPDFVYFSSCSVKYISCFMLGHLMTSRRLNIWKIKIRTDTTLYSKFDEASCSWKQRDLAAELESDLQDIVDWGKKWLVYLKTGKTQIVSFDPSNNTGATDMTVYGCIL